MIIDLPLIDSFQQPIISIVIKQEERPPESVEVVHSVVSGDNLTKIAEQYDTTVERLWAKNTELTNPDLLDINYQLKIPLPDEELVNRPLPVETRLEPIKNTPQSTYRGSSGGNTYTYGYCTAYAKDRRPDLPNNLGNAITWASRASAQGIPTGSTPRAGAIGQQGNHVVYIERVNSDGTVFISEQNYIGWNIISTRTTSASDFTYIY